MRATARRSSASAGVCSVATERRFFRTGEDDAGDAAGKAAGEAARKEAMKSNWPPDRDDTKTIGSAAGAAAGAAACAAVGAAPAAPLCALVGGEVGGALAGAIYDIVDGFFANTTYVAPQFDLVIYRRTRAAGVRLAKLRAGRIPTMAEVAAELEALVRWGLPRDPKPYYYREGLLHYLQLLAAAESARTSEIVAARAVRKRVRLSAPRSPSSGARIGIGPAFIIAGGGLLLWKLLMP